MTKDVLVHISGLHQENGADAGKEHETIEIIVPGSYYLKNGKRYILYEEIEENGKITKSQLKICKEDYVELRKNGVLNSQMIFETGKKHPACYRTPFGTFSVAVDTRMIEITDKDEYFSVEIDYELEVNREPLADCRIEIKITPRL